MQEKPLENWHYYRKKKTKKYKNSYIFFRIGLKIYTTNSSQIS